MLKGYETYMKMYLFFKLFSGFFFPKVLNLIKSSPSAEGISLTDLNSQLHGMNMSTVKYVMCRDPGLSKRELSRSSVGGRVNK